MGSLCGFRCIWDEVGKKFRGTNNLEQKIFPIVKKT